MSGINPTRRIAILDSTFDIAGLFLGFWGTMPGDDGLSGVEVTGGPGNGYARVALGNITVGQPHGDWLAASQAAPSGGLFFPALKIGPRAGVTWTFPAATAPWDPIYGWAVFTNNAAYVPSGAGAAANLLAWGDLTSAPWLTGIGTVLGFDSTHQIAIPCGSLSDVFP